MQAHKHSAVQGRTVFTYRNFSKFSANPLLLVILLSVNAASKDEEDVLYLFTFKLNLSESIYVSEFYLIKIENRNFWKKKKSKIVRSKVSIRHQLVNQWDCHKFSSYQIMVHSKF